MYGDLQGIAGKNTSGDRKVALLDLDCDLAVAPATDAAASFYSFRFRLRALGDPSDNYFGEMFAQ